MSKYVEREILNHKRLIHPHIVQLKEVRTGAPLQLEISTVSSILGCVAKLLWRCEQVFLTQHHLAIAMEYAAGGNLYQLVAMSGGLPEQDARWYFQQLIFAIDYCHKMVRATPATCMINLAAPLLNVVY